MGRTGHSTGNLLSEGRKGKGRGRPPISLVRMLRMYIVQRYFGFSDKGMENAVCDS